MEMSSPLFLLMSIPVLILSFSVAFSNFPYTQSRAKSSNHPPLCSLFEVERTHPYGQLVQGWDCIMYTLVAPQQMPMEASKLFLFPLPSSHLFRVTDMGLSHPKSLLQCSLQKDAPNRCNYPIGNSRQGLKLRLIDWRFHNRGVYEKVLKSHWIVPYYGT